MEGARKARNRVHLTAEVGGSADAVFTFLTDHFGDLWPGNTKVLEPGDDPQEPMGLGMVRLVKPRGSAALEERIVTHERPRLIEYKVINDAPIHNHLGRLELTPTTQGTRLDYTIDFDYRPPFLGPVVRGVLLSTWRLNGARRLRAAFG
jgi:Polyketide cyclase / dehydrase and lipid transport